MQMRFRIEQIRWIDGKQVAKLEGISISKLKESKKIKDGEIIHDVEIGLFRSAVCPNCHKGRMINHGNKCLEYRSTGEQRACIHKYMELTLDLREHTIAR